jgi:hypothetical protein
MPHILPINSLWCNHPNNSPPVGHCKPQSFTPRCFPACRHLITLLGQIPSQHPVLEHLSLRIPSIRDTKLHSHMKMIALYILDFNFRQQTGV